MAWDVKPATDGRDAHPTRVLFNATFKARHTTTVIKNFGYQNVIVWVIRAPTLKQATRSVFDKRRVRCAMRQHTLHSNAIANSLRASVS
jgi:hypothetical protein